MDSKEVKLALKGAKEAIKKKEYKDAIKSCKVVLKHDKTNYNALVFVAVCAEGLGEPQQALVAYQRAIDSSSDQPTAWQGLTAFYEKRDVLTEDEKRELVKCYEKVMALFRENPAKLHGTGQKLGQLHKQLNNLPQCVAVYTSLLSLLSDRPEAELHSIRLELSSVLRQMDKLTEQQQQLLEECCQFIVSSDVTSIKDLETYSRLYLDKLLKTKADETKLSSVCTLIHAKQPSFLYPLEVATVMWLDNVVVHGLQSPPPSCVIDADVKLKKINPSSAYVLLVEGGRSLLDKNYTVAKQRLVEGLKTVSTVTSGWYLLEQAYLKMYQYDSAVESIKTGMKLVTEEKGFCTLKGNLLSDKLKESLLEAWLGQKVSAAAEKALKLVEGAEFEQTLSQKVQVKANLILSRVEEALELSEKIVQAEKSAENFGLLCEAYISVGRLPDAVKLLHEAVLMDDADGRTYFLLGKALWDLNDGQSREMCFQFLLTSAKVDQFYFETFLYLGYYYATCINNLEKAVKCYQKAFELNSTSDIVGTVLTDGLVALGHNEEATKLLLGVTSCASAGCAKWAWLRLGLQQLRDLDYSSSIKSLLCAIRADKCDYHCLEAVGEAYMHRGSYTAALKVFTRASDLDNDAIYPMFLIATIKQLLGSNADASAEYKEVLKKSPDYVPALKGLGESYIMLAKKSLLEFFDGKAVSYCEQAWCALTRAATHRSSLSCLWKLLGDACTVLHCVSDDKVFKVPGKLLDAKSEVGQYRELGKMELLSLGARCYGTAIKIQSDCSSLWHDLGVNYFRQAQHTQCTDLAKECVDKSMKALRKALSIESSNHRHWNALGVVTCSSIVDDPALAQHCFIKSIDCESNNVWAWTNLGALYLSKDNIQLAHEAFKVAQSLSPKYVACWVGQAIIAELVGHEDAMDLFRHTSELANHVESCLGYGHWVCCILLDSTRRNTEMFQYCIHQMAAIPAASDCLARYLERIKDNPVAYNLYGLILENQKLRVSACEAYACAINLLNGSGESSSLLQAVRSNYARSLRENGQFDLAIDQYKLLSEEMTIEDNSGLALTYFKAGAYKEAYILYQEVSQTDAIGQDDVVDLATALGATAVKYGDVNSAKTHLFTCAQMEPKVAFPALLALLATGLVEGDITLSVAALQELEKVDFHIITDKQARDLYTLSTQVYRLQGAPLEAYHHIASAVHKHPWKQSLRVCLARTLCAARQFTAALRCFEMVRSTKHNMDKDDMGLFCLCATGQLLTSPSDDNKNYAVKLCQKAIHMYPDSVQASSSLLVCLQSATDGSISTVVPIKAADSVQAWSSLPVCLQSATDGSISTVEPIKAADSVQAWSSLPVCLQSATDGSISTVEPIKAADSVQAWSSLPVCLQSATDGSISTVEPIKAAASLSSFGSCLENRGMKMRAQSLVV